MGGSVISPWVDWLVGTKSFFLSQRPGLFQFLVSLFEYFLVAAVQFVHRRNITDSTVQPDVVVVIDEPFNHSSGIVKGKRDTGTDTFPLDGLVEPFQFAVGLRIIRRCPHMRHTRDADEFLEILGNKLRPVI